MSLKLYHFEACPYCEKVRCALRRMEVRYESVEIDPSDRAGVMEISGQEKVPVLVDGETVICDSTRILRYLVKSYGGGRFLPDDGRSRALAWVIEEYVDEALIPLLGSQVRGIDAKGAPLDDAGKALIKAELAHHYEALDQLLAGDGFALGTRPTLADIALYSCLSRVELYSPRGIPPEYPAVRSWYARMKG